MFLMKSRQNNTSNFVNVSKKSVQEFFVCSDNIKEKFPKEYEKMSKSPDVIREVFRHSFCLALDLQSVPAYSDLSDLYSAYSSRLRSVVGNTSNWSVEKKQGVLQAGVHFVMFSTKSGKVEMDENYVQ